VADCCEHGSEPSGSVKGEEFFELLSHCLRLKMALIHGGSYFLSVIIIIPVSFDVTQLLYVIQRA
jgi:hypothetical protein